ncbi:hypothetical protein KKH13_00415 [Patescibacteria group bacterium]|nr:hypothetical protein [Patescibacteria group bacterium]
MGRVDNPSDSELIQHVYALPLLSPDGGELEFHALGSHDQLTVAASRSMMESLLAIRNRANFASFSENSLAEALGGRGYTSRLSFGDVPNGQEVIHFQNWHKFLTSWGLIDYRQPVMQAVRVGSIVDDKREVTVLSHQWQLSGLGDVQMKALIHSLKNGKLALQMQPFGLASVGQTATVDCGDYGLLWKYSV